MKQNLMKTARHAMAFLFFLSAIGMVTGTISQAASHEDVKKEMQEAAAAIGEYSVEQKDKAIAEAKELMKKFDQSMDEAESSIKGNWHSLEESAKQNYELSKQEYKKQREELSAWLDKMQDSSGDAWEETKKGFSDAHDALSSSWKKATEHMTKD